MNQEEKFNKVVKIMEASELNSSSQEHLRVFLFSLMDDPQFEMIVEILEKFSGVMDKFTRVFELKHRFFEFGGTKLAWEYILQKEEELIRKVEEKETQVLL